MLGPISATPVPQGIWGVASSVQTVTVRAVTPDHSEAPQYHVLPKDDAEAVVDIMRAAAGLPPLYDEHDDVGD